MSFVYEVHERSPKIKWECLTVFYSLKEAIVDLKSRLKDSDNSGKTFRVVKYVTTQEIIEQRKVK